jgi:general secretion pathway protein K
MSKTDLLKNPTCAEKGGVDTVLESSCTQVYTPVLRAVPPNLSLAQAGFSKGLMLKKIQPSQGSILISVLLIVALIVSITTTMAVHLQINIQEIKTLTQALQMNLIAESVELWTSDDLILSRHDHTPIPEEKNLPEQTESNILILPSQVYDMQSRFNLNDLSIDDTAKRQEWVDRLTLLIKRTVPEYAEKARDIAIATSEWVSPKGQGKPSKASEFYSKQNPPYAMAHQPMESISEWRLVAGVTPKLFEKLSPYLAALPPKSGINLNTTSKWVLLSLNERFTEDQIDNFIKERGVINQPYLNLDTLPEASPFRALGSALVFQSQYFLLSTHVRLDDWTQSLFTLLKLNQEGKQISTQILWQSPNTV